MQHSNIHTNSWLIGGNGRSTTFSLGYCFTAINPVQDKPRLKPGWNDTDDRG